MKADRNADNQKLEIESSECRRKIEEFSQNLKQQIEKLEKAALNDVADFVVKERKEIGEHIDTCCAALTKLNMDYQRLNSTPPNQENVLFTHSLQLTKTIEHVEKVLNDMASEVVKPNIDFKGDITIIRADVKSLGTMRTTGVTATHPAIPAVNVK